MANIDDALVHLFHPPSAKAAEAFRGFINLFDDYLAQLGGAGCSVDLIWGERDPWEPIAEAKRWAQTLGCIRSLGVIPNAGHCPHDEAPEAVMQH